MSKTNWKIEFANFEMKLYERLKLRPHMWESAEKLEGVAIARNVKPEADHYDLAWKKFDLPYGLHLVALASYYSDEHEAAKKYATECIEETEEFFFGEWRNSFSTPEKRVDPSWWKRRFIWMQVFEAVILWGAVLGKWEFLKRVGSFPERDSCIGDGYHSRDRDLYVAWAAFLRNGMPGEVDQLMKPLEKSKESSCKLRIGLMRAAAERNADALQKAMEDWLSYYRKWEFPKEQITKKISIEGTFFVHWASKEGIALEVPPEYDDHIVHIR